LGLVYAFELHGHVIGTIRMVPARYGLTLTEQLLERATPGFRERWPNGWEAGRLVIAPDYRVGQDVLKRCLYLTLLHMLENVEVQHLLGSCTHALSRLYRRFGFDVVARDATVPGLEKTYSLIHGEVATVYAALGTPGHRVAEA
jgi:hypothetical protein